MGKCAEAHKGLAAVEKRPTQASLPQYRGGKPECALGWRSCQLVRIPFIRPHSVRGASYHVRYICASYNAVYNQSALC